MVVAYFLLVGSFYFIASSYPALYDVQFADEIDCDRPGVYCANPKAAHQGATTGFYSYLALAGLWGAFRLHNRAWRLRTEQAIWIPYLKWRTSPSELIIVIASLSIKFSWFGYWYDRVSAKVFSISKAGHRHGCAGRGE